MRIVIVGLGIIGGSLAKAFTKYTKHHVIGINRTQATAELALSEGAIHEIGTKESLKTADVVYMCTYPQHIINYVEENAEYFGKNCIITDVCGIKRGICSSLAEICKKNGLTFCGSHPMAGKEQFSYSASDPELFKGASYIVVPCGVSDENAVKTLSNLALEIGFERIRVSNPEEHDRMIAFTSQLPHVLACAYVKSPCCPNHVGFSAGSYRDVSRVAAINENLWTDLFIDNKEPLCAELDVLIQNLQLFRELINSSNDSELKKQLEQSRIIKQSSSSFF